ATNRQQIIDTVWFGQADYTPSIVVDATAELPKSEVQQLLAYDPKGAQDLLKAAGVSNWSPTLTVWNNPQSQPGGELIVPMWQQVGVKPNEQLVDNAKSVQIMTTGDGISIHWGAWPSLPT